MISTSYNPFRREFWFGRIDSRPLSLFRIVFGALLLKDALYHIPLAYTFFSDRGIVPRAAVLQLGRIDRFSLMDAMGQWWMADAFFLLWAVVAALLMVGYRARLMSILNFIIVMSIHERNVYILSGADSIQRALSFWMMFVPLAGYYSVDAWRALREGRSPDRAAYAFPVRMMQLQVAVVYVFAGWLKLLGETWMNGEALHYVFQLNTMLLPLGVWLRDLAPPWLLSLGTWATVFFELSFIVLVFAPVLQPRLRAIALIGGLLLHGGIGVMMSIPDFSLTMLASYLVLFDPRWVKRLEGRLLPRTPPDEPEPLVNVDHVQSETEVDVSNIEASASYSPSPLRERGGWGVRFRNAFLAIAMLGVIWWNVDYLGDYGQPVIEMPPSVRSVMWYSGLWQYWDLFAPLPLQIDGWTTIPGVFEDGTTRELRNDQPYSDEPIRAWFGPDVRFEKFEENVYGERYEPILLAWGRYFCHQYNTVRALPEGQRLATLEIHFRYRRSHAPGEPPNDVSDELLWTHWCYDEYAY